MRGRAESPRDRPIGLTSRRADRTESRLPPDAQDRLDKLGMTGRWREDGSEPDRILAVATVAIVLAYVAAQWLLRYDTTFGERDSYRVFAGLLQSFRSGRPLATDLVYGYGASKGYFALIAWLVDPSVSAERLARILNAVSFVSGALLLAPVYVIGRVMAGPRGAAWTLAALVTVPLWLHGSRYAHPMWPAILLATCAIALLAIRDTTRGLRRAAVNGGVVVLMAGAMTMRLDVILMGPMALAFATDGTRLDLRRLASLAGLGLVTLAVTGLILFALPSLAGGQSVLATLASWHNPKRFLTQAPNAHYLMLRALNPALILAFLASVAHLWKRWDVRCLLLVLPTVLLNYLFWIPNPQPARHFLYLVPAFALGIGFCAAHARDVAASRNDAAVLIVLSILVLALGLGAPARFLYLAGLPVAAMALWRADLPGRLAHGRPAALAGAAALVLGMSLAPGWLVFNNPYLPDQGVRLGRLADTLSRLPPDATPIIVLGDGYPILARLMDEFHRPATWTADETWLDAQVGSAHVLFYMPFYRGDRSEDEILARAAGDPARVVVDGEVASRLAARLAGKPGIVDVIDVPAGTGRS